MNLRNEARWILAGVFTLLMMLPLPSRSAEKDAMEGGATPEVKNMAAVDAGTTAEFKTGEGYRQLAAGENSAALLSFEEALRLNPRAVAAKTGTGIALARQGNFQEAEQILREALELNPDPSRIHYELGVIYQKMGDDQRAMAEFKHGIQKYRGNYP